MHSITQAEELQLRSFLRPGEDVLWLGKGGAPLAESASKSGWLKRLFGGASTQSSAEPVVAHVYAITPTRVLDVAGGELRREWMLMLGMVQKVDSRADGRGDIVFDYEQHPGVAELMPRGLLNIVDVSSVHAKLAAAIDAAYLASPWT